MDKSNIRTVIHYSLPSTVEAYLQESGRAGRDRRPCRAILLYHPEDKRREEKNPNAELRSRYEKLLAFAEDSGTCRRESLLAILEAEPEDCDNCDVCCDQVLSKDPAQDLLTVLVRRYDNRLTPTVLQDFLLGRHSRPIRQGLYHRSWGFGSLRDWDPDDVKELIRGTITKGAINICDKGIRKGCLRRTTPLAMPSSTVREACSPEKR